MSYTVTVWLDRLLKRVFAANKPLVFTGGESYGVPFVLDAVASRVPLAWVDLQVADAGDYIAQGNRLAVAVNEALGVTLLPQALPLHYVIEVLKSRLDHVGQLAIAVSNADFAPLLVDALIPLKTRLTLLFDYRHGATPLKSNLEHIDESVLSLTLVEAHALADNALDAQTLENLWRSSAGAYLTFMTGLRRLRNEPTPTVPAAGKTLTRDSVAVAPEALLKVLLESGRFVEALDLAVMSLPGQVADIIDVVAPAYQEQGLFHRLHLLLESLDAVFQTGESVLAWRLLAAYYVGEHAALLPEVEAFLEAHEAPVLRARYAGIVRDPEKQFTEAKRAAGFHSTSLTLFQYGRLHPDHQEGITILRAALRLAETQHSHYDAARNAGALAERLIHLGRYAEAADWSEWAVRLFDKANLKDGPRRLRLLNNWAFARIMIGQTAGLYDEIRETLTHLSYLQDSMSDLVVLFRSTLADLELVLGHTELAEEHAEKNLTQSPRLLLGRYSVPLVRVLLEKGAVTLAVRHAERVARLTAGEAPRYHQPAQLALGMALAFHAPEQAIPLLTPVMHDRDLLAHYRLTAAFYLRYLDASTVVPEDILELYGQLSPSGFKLLCGPDEAFRVLRGDVLGEIEPLQIRVLGNASVFYEGKRLNLSSGALEILVLLACNPEGLSLEALHTKLYEDDTRVKLSSLRSSVSRLRERVPISSSPYRIMVPFYFDAKHCMVLLQQEKVREALDLYQGSILALSDAPGVREQRGQLDEFVRQVVLRSNDVEALMVMCQRWQDDYELWTALERLMLKNDPRRALVKARLTLLRKEFDWEAY